MHSHRCPSLTPWERRKREVRHRNFPLFLCIAAAWLRRGAVFLATIIASVIGTLVMGLAANVPYALVIVGVMMMSSFREIDWTELSEAIPAFFAGVFMALCYSISYGIAAGFFFYCLLKICKKQAKEIHPIIWVSTALFVLNFILTAAM